MACIDRTLESWRCGGSMLNQQLSSAHYLEAYGMRCRTSVLEHPLHRHRCLCIVTLPTPTAHCQLARRPDSALFFGQATCRGLVCWTSLASTSNNDACLCCTQSEHARSVHVFTYENYVLESTRDRVGRYISPVGECTSIVGMFGPSRGPSEPKYRQLYRTYLWR